MSLGLVLVWYAATSEVSWLYLLASWVLAALVVCLGYALWNRSGLTLHLGVRSVRHAEGSPMEDLPEQVLRTSPMPAPVFEGDGVGLVIGLDTTGGSKGPAWVAGVVGGADFAAGTGVVPRLGWRTEVGLPSARRGPVGATGWRISTSDPLGFFVSTRRSLDSEVAVVLPRFGSLVDRRQSRELEASAAAPRAGAGNELFGVREYHSGDSLRRIHWRSSARRGELVVREYEPPGVQTLAIYVDPAPASTEVADQVARLAASEAWDCIREGGRVVIWSPGLLATAPNDARELWVLLEWLARYPGTPGDDPQPFGAEAVMVSGPSEDPRLVEAIEGARRRGARTRAWIVSGQTNEREVELDAPTVRVGLEWPLQ